jgi:hypothetical protein
VHADILRDSYSAEGMWGHCAVVIPRAKLVVVIRVDTRLPSWTPGIATRGNRDAMVEVPPPVARRTAMSRREPPPTIFWINRPYPIG